MRCPYCHTDVDTTTAPIVARNYTFPQRPRTTDDFGAPVEGDVYGEGTDAPSEPRMEPDAVYTADYSSAAQPASGATAVGHLGVLPVLHDPASADERRGRPPTLDDFDTVDRPAHACRSCESALHPRLAEYDRVAVIAVVGLGLAGKSHYITAMAEEVLRRQQLRRLGVGDARAALDSARPFHERSQQVYEKHEPHPRTVVGASHQVWRTPLAIELMMRQDEAPSPAGLRGFFGGGGPREPEKVLLLFHDVAGEHLALEKERSLYFDFLNHAEAIIFLVDPIAIRSVARRIAGRVPIEFINPITHLPQEALLHSLADQLGRAAADLPVSIVLNKADLLEEALGPGILPDLPEATSLDELGDQIADLHDHVVEKVMPLLDEPALLVAAERFPQAVWHLAAPLGMTPNEDGKLPGPPQPWRIIDPLYRALRGL